MGAAAELLEKGIYTEETKGDLKSAIQVYQQIVDDARAERSLVAQAQLRLGLCQLKLGNQPQAISALDRLRQEFPDPDQLIAIVGRQMPQVLDEIVQQIERNYIREIDRGELIETALQAIVGKLDSHLLRTNDMEFLGASQMKELNESIDQKLAGIGIALSVDGGAFIVQSALADSPALKAGLRTGDRIYAINGTELNESSKMAAVVKMLRGPVGTPVSVAIQRDGVEDIQVFDLVRDTIRIASVRGDHRREDGTWDFMLDAERKIGYVRISQVGGETLGEMRSAMSELHRQGLKALVLDLRDCPGGLLNGAVSVADMFLQHGRILTVKGRGGETVHDARSTDTNYMGFPIAILANRQTASAAEIIAAALQDQQRAVVVGERTIGHGIVRSIFPLSGGVGALKLPIATYYRPSGKSVNRYPDSKDTDDWGVQPSPGFEVVFSKAELTDYRAYVSARSDASRPAAALPEFTDRQMERALEYIATQLKGQ
jgi:carboxyl-terminal processing protease